MKYVYYKGQNSKMISEGKLNTKLKYEIIEDEIIEEKTKKIKELKKYFINNKKDGK